MASMNILEDEVTYLICQYKFHEPHILKCLHTFCHKCIEELKKGNRITCPTCRKVTNIENVRKDFNKQRLVDTYMEHINSQDTQVKKCRKCEKNRAISYYCDKCKFICDGCHTFHTKSEELKSHELQPVGEILERYETNVEDVMKQLQQEVDSIDTKLGKVSTNSAHLQESNREQIANVKQLTQDIVNDLRRNEKRLVAMIQNTNDDLSRRLDEKENSLTKFKEEVRSKVKLLDDKIKTRDVVMLHEELKGITQKITDEVKTIKSSYPNVDVFLTSPVTVNKKQNSDVADSIEAIISEQKEPMVQGTYSHLWKKKFWENEKTTLDNHNPPKMIYSNKHLWRVDWEANLHEYDEDCRLVNTIKHDNTVAASSLTVMKDTGYIIVACRSNNGLHEFLPVGKYHKQIAPGSFSDVTTYDGNLYALESNRNEVQVFKKVYSTTKGLFGTIMGPDDKWICMKPYKVNYSNGHIWDRICVNDRGTYISSYHNQCIYVYNPNGEFQRQIGGPGTSVGEFLGPFLCGIDESDNILVADSNNHRLQVRDYRGQWRVIPLPTEVDYPVSAVVGRSGQMWVLHRDPWTLVKLFTERKILELPYTVRK